MRGGILNKMPRARMLLVVHYFPKGRRSTGPEPPVRSEAPESGSHLVNLLNKQETGARAVLLDNQFLHRSHEDQECGSRAGSRIVESGARSARIGRIVLINVGSNGTGWGNAVEPNHRKKEESKERHYFACLSLKNPPLPLGLSLEALPLMPHRVS
ncbi:hypothetical protein EVAR_39235_1 [Eumeta japonica]|uniref:Uncharacterized protein n=1 Tax=Eumeta variegata TaxID=151549 RepID=A0A4C1VLT3_EUMVA|nr:hypothetical protein EVAR_39235_1 [Eumeta japonica]